MNLFSDKEKQLFRNSKFHVILSTIFSQLTPKSNSYSAMVCHWCHLISHVPKHKTHPNLVMTQHIRECSNPSARWDRDSGITSPYAKTQDCSIFSTPMLMMLNMASPRDQSIDLSHISIYWSLHDTSLTCHKSFITLVLHVLMWVFVCICVYGFTPYLQSKLLSYCRTWCTWSWEKLATLCESILHCMYISLECKVNISLKNEKFS